MTGPTLINYLKTRKMKTQDHHNEFGQKIKLAKNFPQLF